MEWQPIYPAKNLVLLGVGQGMASELLLPLSLERSLNLLAWLPKKASASVPHAEERTQSPEWN